MPAEPRSQTLNPTSGMATSATSTTPGLAHRALYQEVAEHLRQQIFSRQLEPGAWIDELKLCGELGISRTPMREALKVLAVEGLVRRFRREDGIEHRQRQQAGDEHDTRKHPFKHRAPL